MSIELVSSSMVSDLDLVPPHHVAPGYYGATVKYVHGVALPTAAGLIGSVYRVVRVHSSWTMVAFHVDSSDFLSHPGRFDVGFWEANGGPVIDVDALLADVDASGGEPSSDWVHTTNTSNTAGELKRFWEILGVSSDPRVFYDVVAKTKDGNNDAAGSIHISLMYTDAPYF